MTTALLKKLKVKVICGSSSNGRWRSARSLTSTSSVMLSNQIKSLLLSHHHSTSALVSEILMSVLQTVHKNNRQFTYGQTVQKKKKKKKIYIWTDSAKKTTNNLHMDRQCKKLHWSIYSAPDSAKKTTTAIYIWTDSAKKQQQFTYGQYIFTDCTEDNVQNTHTCTQYA